MNNIPENIPAEIFEFISLNNFDSLTDQEQKFVLQFINRELYDELREAHLILSDKSLSTSTEDTFLPVLLQNFDTIHATPKAKFTIHWPSVSAVTAAACMLTAVILFRNQQPSVSPINLAYHDTVYWDNPDTIRIFDTVYQQVQSERKQHTQTIEKVLPNVEILPEVNDVNSAPIESYSRNRSQSIKDDSLISQFGFAKL